MVGCTEMPFIVYEQNKKILVTAPFSVLLKP